MITCKDLRERKVFDQSGRDIFDYEDGWINTPFNVEEMLRAYRCGALAKARYVFEHLKMRVDAIGEELDKLKIIEDAHGNGCLMDLDDKSIRHGIKHGFLKIEMNNALKYKEFVEQAPSA